MPYLNLAYNTTINGKTGARSFSKVHGQECQYPVDLFHKKSHDEVMIKDGFGKWPDEQFRDAHSSAREILGTDQRRQKSCYWKKIQGNPVRVLTKSGCGQRNHKCQRREGPYVLMARMSEVNYQVSKVSIPNKVKFLHFNMLKLYV